MNPRCVACPCGSVCVTCVVSGWLTGLQPRFRIQGVYKSNPNPRNEEDGTYQWDEVGVLLVCVCVCV